jgi:predicted RNA-binding protein with PUA-like domain
MKTMDQRKYWLVKQEPEDYAWSVFVKEGRTAWTGIRNFEARNNLRGMREEDLVAYYHSGTGKEVVGIARVVRGAYPDPTAKEGDWCAVDLAPVRELVVPVPLAAIKTDAVLVEMPLVKKSRLSTMPLTAGQFARLLQVGRTKL